MLLVALASHWSTSAVSMGPHGHSTWRSLSDDAIDARLFRQLPHPLGLSSFFLLLINGRHRVSRLLLLPPIAPSCDAGNATAFGCCRCCGRLFGTAFTFDISDDGDDCVCVCFVYVILCFDSTIYGYGSTNSVCQIESKKIENFVWSLDVENRNKPMYSFPFQLQRCDHQNSILIDCNCENINLRWMTDDDNLNISNVVVSPGWYKWIDKNRLRLTFTCLHQAKFDSSACNGTDTVRECTE